MRIGAGDQPVPGPTLPESSSADRKAWLRKGSPPASESQAAGSSAETPDPIRARTSDSRSAIGFPDECIGMNRALRALLWGADGPAVDRHPAARPLAPRLAERSAIHGEEVRLGKPQGYSALEGGQIVADDQPAPNAGKLRLDEP